MATAVKKKPPVKPRTTGMPNGRPTSLNKEVIEKIQQALMACAYIETAAHHAGITRESFYTWFKRGKVAKALVYNENTGDADRDKIPQAEKIYVEFADMVESAISGSELRLLKQIDDAARDGAWQAAAWRLERKFPKRWGRAVDDSELKNISIYNTLHIDVGMLSEDKIDQRIAQLLSKAGVTHEHETLLIDGQTTPGKKDAG